MMDEIDCKCVLYIEHIVIEFDDASTGDKK